MTSLPLLASLVALLLGLLVGKGWERYKLRDGRWIDRRRLRDTPHYMLGLNFLVDHQVDQAIDELTQATSTDTDALEIQMILGNLYRGKGQVARAITVHQALLQRPDLTAVEHAYVLLCLGLDYRSAGFVDRALEAFEEVLVLDPRNRYALVHLQKLHEEQQRWGEAFLVRERIATLDGGDRPEDAQILGFLRYQIGRAHQRDGQIAEAARRFEEAIEIDARTAPAYLDLGDVRDREGRLGEAVDVWERLTAAQPDRAYLAFDRLERAYRTLGTPGRFVEFCRGVIARQPHDWRGRLALSAHLSGDGRPRDAFELLLGALPHNPHGLVLHQAVWQTLAALAFEPALVERYVALTRRAVFYLDPHVCIRCRYRSTELLWQCPQCHEWNTFVEERLAAAKPAVVETDAAGDPSD